MRILKLSKEIGVPYEKILVWCNEEGMPYKDPDEEITDGHIIRIKAAFLKPSSRKYEKTTSDADSSLEDLEAVFGDDPDLDIEGLPDTLEELEALEQNLFKNGARSSPPKPKADRLLVKSILKKFGIENRGVIKKVRKLLPEHVSRLFNHESLAEEQSALFQQALKQKVTFYCGDPVCRKLLKGVCSEKNLIQTQASSVCSLCGGSSIRRGMEVMAEACKNSDFRRLLIVGGAPSAHKELNKHKPPGLSLKLIEGDVSRDKQRAAADLQWCDLAVIWAGTILEHGVSQNYTRSGSKKVITVNRRSIEALCETVVQWIDNKNL